MVERILICMGITSLKNRLASILTLEAERGFPIAEFGDKRSGVVDGE